MVNNLELVCSGSYFAFYNSNSKKMANKENILQHKKEQKEIKQADIYRLNIEFEKTLEDIIDKTENENTAFKKIIKAFDKVK